MKKIGLLSLLSLLSGALICLLTACGNAQGDTPAADGEASEVLEHTDTVITVSETSQETESPETSDEANGATDITETSKETESPETSVSADNATDMAEASEAADGEAEEPAQDAVIEGVLYPADTVILDLKDSWDVDIDELVKLKDLEELYIGEDVEIEDMSIFYSFRKLRVLYFYGDYVSFNSSDEIEEFYDRFSQTQVTPDKQTAYDSLLDRYDLHAKLAYINVQAFARRGFTNGGFSPGFYKGVIEQKGTADSDYTYDGTDEGLNKILYDFESLESGRSYYCCIIDEDGFPVQVMWSDDESLLSYDDITSPPASTRDFMIGGFPEEGFWAE